ncbi:MAG TPA: hypothetical protein VNB64_07760 [Solirubrobacteraceae bacterium]|nr:hypothetical protein [Solirubrobacteraceae bacterium]
MTTATAPAPLFTLPGADPVEPVAPGVPAAEPRSARVHRLAHGRLTLDELVSGAWAAIGAGFPAACPLCEGALRSRPGTAGHAACSRCGSQLA